MNESTKMNTPILGYDERLPLYAWYEDIDVTRARAAKERAETALRGEHDATVEADLRRAHARLSATGGIA